MSKNPIIPDTWGIPNDLAKEVSETLNKKRITPEDKLADALEEMARDFALIEPDPKDWESGWVICWRRWRRRQNGGVNARILMR